MSQTVRNLAIAIALALVGVVLTTSYIKSEKKQLSRGKEEVTVLVAKQDIPAGTPAKSLIESGKVEEQDILREDLPPQALGDLKGMSKVSTNQIIKKGDFITGVKFGTKESLNPADSIKGTERIVSLPVTPMGRVANYVKPGDHVDMIACSDGAAAVPDSLVPTSIDGAQGNSPVCFIAARDLVVESTPESLLPKSDGEEPAPAEPLKAKDDAELYAFSGSDKVIMDLVYAYSFSTDDKLIMLLRPSDGDQESTIDPQFSIAENN